MSISSEVLLLLSCREYSVLEFWGDERTKPSADPKM